LGLLLLLQGCHSLGQDGQAGGLHLLHMGTTSIHMSAMSAMGTEEVCVGNSGT
jgi:hypothetical protein